MSINIENINYDDFKNICRICMLNCDIKFHLDSVVSSIFHKLTDLHFETNDDLPKQVCGKCFEKINEIQEFIFKCKQTHGALVECLNNFKQVQIKQEEVLPNDRAENTNITKKCQFVIYLEKPVTIEGKNNINAMIEINKNIEMGEGIIPETSEIKEEVIENTDLQETSYNIKEEITIEEHKIEFVKEEHSVLKNDCSESEIFSGERAFKCDQCSKSFSRKGDLKTHMRTHSAERPFKCDQCLKSFNQVCNLNRHMRTHAGERTFKCDQCSKSFNQSSHLKIHLRIHSGERPSKCDKCSKSFNQLSNLKRHMRTHTAERSFKCDQCSKSFRQPSRLKNHLRMHSGKRSFKCDQCLKSFNQPGHLRLHLRIHSGERPFKCDKCSKSFTFLSTLKTHINKNKCSV